MPTCRTTLNCGPQLHPTPSCYYGGEERWILERPTLKEYVVALIRQMHSNPYGTSQEHTALWLGGGLCSLICLSCWAHSMHLVNFWSHWNIQLLRCAISEKTTAVPGNIRMTTSKSAHQPHQRRPFGVSQVVSTKMYN
jgi:hypothetical protein